MEWYHWLLLGIIIGWILRWSSVVWENAEPSPRKPEPSKEQAGQSNKEGKIASTKEFIELKERLQKTNGLLNSLDEWLATGGITEAKYRELAEKYRTEANSLKDLIIDIELLSEQGTIGNNESNTEVADAIEGLCRLGYKKQKVKEIIQSIQTSGMNSQEIMKAVMAKA